MLAEDVLRLCGGKAPGGSVPPPQQTPRQEDAPARLKRQRLTVARSPVQNRGSWPHEEEEEEAEQAVPAAPAASAASAARTAQVVPVLPWQASLLLDYVQRCLDNLTTMHPQCSAIQAHTKAAELARVYFARGAPAQARLLGDAMLTQALLAAALWVAIKFEGNRCAMPDSSVMARITGFPAGLLRAQERVIIAALDWDLMSCAREVGAVGLPDPTDAACQDQQMQLAALAAAPAAPAPFAIVAAAPAPAAPAPVAAVVVRERRQVPPHVLHNREVAQLRNREAAQLLALLAGAQQGLPLGGAGLAANLMAHPLAAAPQVPYAAVVAPTIPGSDVSSHLNDDMRRLWAAI